MIKKTFMALMFGLFLLSSCHTPNVSYFNDLEHLQSLALTQKADIRLRTDDKLSIVVKSKDPLLSDLFNLPIVTHRVGYTQASSLNSSQQISAYTVDPEGQIDFPVLGPIKVAGLRRDEVAEYIKAELINRNLVKDPVVTVEYGNLGFDVLGEVNKPGRYAFDRDHLTILDALSMAGDLTIQGRRQNVCLMREASDGQHVVYRLDLQKGQELLQSPAYYLQQNDVVYVEPNNFRARQTTANGNNIFSAAFWISVASLLTSIGTTVLVAILNYYK